MEQLKREKPRRTGVAGRLRTYLITGLLALAPTVITLWVLILVLNWMDNLLGRYLRFPFLDYHRIPGLGLVATVLLLLLVGWIVTLVGRWLGGRPLLAVWDALLTRIPGVGLLYGSTKSIGEAFFMGRQSPFKQVVLVPWPTPGIYRIGFIAARPPAEVSGKLGRDCEVVFVPHSPNPASGFVHYVPRSEVIYLDWPVEDGVKVIVSGGVLQPGEAPPPGGLADTAFVRAAPAPPQEGPGAAGPK
jgi:uncharacterized membrane protein